MPLIDPRDLASYLKQDLDEFDAYTAQLLLDGATEAVTEYCGWHIAPNIVETVVIDGSGTALQPVPTMWLTDLGSVSENGRTVPTSSVDWSSYGILEKRGGGLWTARRGGVEVRIAHGFDAAPAWLTTMICAVAGRAFLGNLGVVQESSSGESVTYASPTRGTGGTVILLPEEKRMLNRLALPKAD